MNASDELESPKRLAEQPDFHQRLGLEGYANSGKTKMRKGTNSAEPLIPTVLAMVAPMTNGIQSHQYSSQ